MQMTRPFTPLKTMVLLFFLSTGLLAYSQQDSVRFYEKSRSINITGMYVLGSWALLNIASGGAGWYRGEAANRYFHQMNVMWNTVNLAIAGFSIVSQYAAPISLLSPAELAEKHLTTERLYLINAGLDVLYMGTGIGLKAWSEKNSRHQYRLNGYGNSLLLQGAFLLVFDAAMYLIQHTRRISFGNVQPELVLGLQSFSLQIRF